MAVETMVEIPLAPPAEETVNILPGAASKIQSLLAERNLT